MGLIAKLRLLFSSASKIFKIEDYMRNLIPIDRLEKMKMRKCRSMAPTIKDTPSSFSLVSRIRKVYNQGSTSSCTANALCQAFNIMNTEDPSFEPSRLYIYARERQMEDMMIGKISITDDGADEADALFWASTIGICPESSWPFIPSKVNHLPPISCDREACSHRIHNVLSVPQSLDGIKTTISSGHPVLAAIALQSYFFSPSAMTNGKIPMPDSISTNLGGHEVLIVGYDDSISSFLLVNSWGPNWGCQPEGATSRGYFWLPYDFVMNTSLCYCLYTFEKTICIC